MDNGNWRICSIKYQSVLLDIILKKFTSSQCFPKNHFTIILSSWTIFFTRGFLIKILCSFFISPFKSHPHCRWMFLQEIPFPTWLSRSYCTNRISLLLHSTFNQNPVGDPFKTEIWLLYDTLPFTSMCILYMLKLLNIHLQISEWKESVALTR